MTDNLAAARERHRLYSITGHCRDCGFKWPCDAALFRDALDKLREVAEDISAPTYVDDGVVAHVPFRKLHALRAALYGTDDEIYAALAKWEASRAE